MSVDSKLLKDFLGTKRWAKLLDALKEQTQTAPEPLLPTHAILIALVVSITPIAATILNQIQPSNIDLASITFGVCTLLAIILRKRFGLIYKSTLNFKESLSLAHTAFALGCIPTVIILALNPDVFADRHDILTSFIPSSEKTQVWTTFDLVKSIFFLVVVVLWVAVTEEFLFRGLLISTLRRWRLLKKQIHRDIVAGILSAVLFGAAHYPTWGLLPAIALSGLGLGFVIAYLADGERLMPIIIYHACFDGLSLLATILISTTT